jgi:hypothetical protein
MTTFKQAACCVGLVVVVTQTSLRQTPAVEVPGRFADLKPVPGLDLPYFQFVPSLTRDELTISGKQAAGPLVISTPTVWCNSPTSSS